MSRRSSAILLPQRSMLSNPNIAAVYVWYADFPIAVGAPIGATYNSEVGTWNIADTASRLSISGGSLVGNGIGAGGGDPRFILNQLVSRSGGLVGRFDFTFTQPRGGIGMADSLTPTGNLYNGITNNGGVLNLRNAGNVVGPHFALSTGVAYKMFTALRPTGGAHLLFEESAGVIVNQWPDDNGLGSGSSTLAPVTLHKDTSYVINVSTMRGRRLGGSYAEQYGLAFFHYATAQANGLQASGVADGFLDTEYAIPGAPAALNEMGVYYRRQGADNANCFHAYLQRNAAGTQWDAKLDIIQAGVVTNLITVTNVLTTDTVRAVFQGNSHWLYTRNGTTWTQRGGTITNATFNTETGTALGFVGSFTHQMYTCWAYRSTQQPLYVQVYD
jgi:hypothetical protein